MVKCTEGNSSSGAYLGQLCLLHCLVLHESTRNEGAHFSSAVSPILAQLLEVLKRDVVALPKGECLNANTQKQVQVNTVRGKRHGNQSPA